MATANASATRRRPPEADKPVTLRELMTVCFRHKWKIVAIFLIIVVCATGYLLLVPHSYTSSAALLFRTARANLSFDPDAEGVISSIQEREEAVAQNAAAVLRSQGMAEIVVLELGADTILDDLPPGPLDLLLSAGGGAGGAGDANKKRVDAIEYVQDGLRVGVDGQVVNLSFVSTAPELAQQILEVLTTRYIDRHFEDFGSVQSVEILESELLDVQAELDEKQDRLEELKRRYNILAVETERTALATRIALLREQLSTARTEAARLGAKVGILQEAVQARPDTVELSRAETLNPVVDSIKTELVALRIEQQDTAFAYQENNRNVELINDKIDELEAQLRTEPESLVAVTQGIDTIRQQLEQQLAIERAEFRGAEAQVAQVESDLEIAREELSRLVGAIDEVSLLEEDIAALRETLTQYNSSFNSAKISAALDRDRVGNVSRFQAPTLPTEPSGRGKRETLMIIGFLALVASFGTAFVFEYLDDTIKTPRDVDKYLDVPILASISEEDFARVRR